VKNATHNTFYLCENATHNNFTYVKMLTDNTTFFQILLLEGERYLVKDSIPLPRSSERVHRIVKDGHWRNFLRVSLVLKVNLVRQRLNGLRRESLKKLERRTRTRLAHTRGSSRQRINVACGRPLRRIQTRAQRRSAEALGLCKHLVRFHREEDMEIEDEREEAGPVMEVLEEAGGEEDANGYMEEGEEVDKAEDEAEVDEEVDQAEDEEEAYYGYMEEGEKVDEAEDEAELDEEEADGDQEVEQAEDEESGGEQDLPKKTTPPVGK